MSGNVHVRFREKGGGLKWPCCTSLSSSMGSALFFLGEYANMILMRCGALHLTFVGLPSSGACVPACVRNPSGRRLVVGGPAELSEKGSLGGADTPARITGDGYKNGGEVNSTRRHSGMDVDPSGRDNHSGPGRGGDHSQEPKRLS
ncbi:hypothetical protein ACFE04_019713 [Oxalis oulophora]